MARRWSSEEERINKSELERLYIRDNRSLSEVAVILKVSESGVYYRIKRLAIPIIRDRKLAYNNIRRDIVIPLNHTVDLAELVGILLGDGSLTKTQVVVTVNNNEQDYIRYIERLIKGIFTIQPKVVSRKKEHASYIYFGSTRAVRYFICMGLAFNKVREQVGVPQWIMEDKRYMGFCLRGLIDTDGSIYKLKFGVQLSFTNRSRRLLQNVRKIFRRLGFRPSKISGKSLYLTNRHDLIKYYQEIGFSNTKHQKRFLKFMPAGVWEVVKPSRL